MSDDFPGIFRPTPRPPYEEDFFQRIVNVNWGTMVKQQWLLGKVPRSDENNSPTLLRFVGPWTAVTGNGQTFAGVATGASLRGYTVLSSGCVVAGKVAGNDMFMVVSADGNVQMGAFGDKGLEWQTVWSVPGYLIHASFAGKAFFIAYSPPGTTSANTRLAVSFDGKTFKSGIAPFSFTDNSDDFNFGGPPAYLNGVYCSTGSYFVFSDDNNYVYTDNLMWSTSSDGLSWSGTYDSTTFGGIGAETLGQYFVAAGNGTFAAPAALNRRATHGQFPLPDQDGVTHQAGVATSTNGQDWSVTALPGAEWRNSWELGDRISDSYAICFVRTTTKLAKLDASGNPISSGNEGYFVISTITGGGVEATHPSDLYVDNAKVMTSENEWFAALSAIDEKLDMNKVIIK